MDTVLEWWWWWWSSLFCFGDLGSCHTNQKPQSRWRTPGIAADKRLQKESLQTMRGQWSRKKYCISSCKPGSSWTKCNKMIPWKSQAGLQLRRICCVWTKRIQTRETTIKCRLHLYTDLKKKNLDSRDAGNPKGPINSLSVCTHYSEGNQAQLKQMKTVTKAVKQEVTKGGIVSMTWNHIWMYMYVRLIFRWKTH